MSEEAPKRRGRAPLYEQEFVKAKCLEFINGTEERVSTSRISTAVDIPVNYVRKAMKALHDEGQVGHEGEKRASVYFKL